MTAYYCDLAASFVNRSGADSGDNVLTGPGGFQAKISGIGLASALAAGDILYCKGTADLSKFVTLTCGKDVTGWDLGDSVRNDTGDGDHWTGKVCQTNVGATNTKIRVQLDTGNYAAANGNKADGIENTTKSDTTTVSTVANDGPDCGTVAGDVASGYIKFIGCDDSWTAYAAQAVLDGNSGSVSCIRYTSAADYYWFQNFTFKRATGDGLYRAGSQPDGWVLIDCIMELNTGDGVGDYPLQWLFVRCLMRNNGACGSGQAYDNVRMIGCFVYGNTSDGINTDGHQGHVHFGGVYAENGGNQLEIGRYGLAINCVIDGEDDASSGHGVSLIYPAAAVFGCRITHNDAASKNGIDSGASAGKLVVADYNAFFDNTADMDSDVQDLGHNDTSMADDGYTDRASLDYNVASGKDLRSEAIEINWG